MWNLLLFRFCSAQCIPQTMYGADDVVIRNIVHDFPLLLSLSPSSSSLRPIPKANRFNNAPIFFNTNLVSISDWKEAKYSQQTVFNWFQIHKALSK